MRMSCPVTESASEHMPVFRRSSPLPGTNFTVLHNKHRPGPEAAAASEKQFAPGTNRESLRFPLTLEAGRMQDYQAQRLLNYALDWRALFIWTLIIVGCSLAGIAFVPH